MVSAVHASARVFRVRTEFIALGREMRVHVLCECGSGAWIAAIAPFPDLFFDERPLIGRSVGEALAWLEERYAGLRVVAEILGPAGGDGGPPLPRLRQKSAGKAEARPEARLETRPETQPEARKPRRRTRQREGQGELPLLCPKMGAAKRGPAKRGAAKIGAPEIGGRTQERAR